MAVDAGYSDYLKSPALYAVAQVAGVTAAYGDNVIDQEAISALALASDAQTEANRIRDFFSQPIARDSVIVRGFRPDLIGKLITVTNQRAGYAAGALCFVIGYQEQEQAKLTQLTVLRRL